MIHRCSVCLKHFDFFSKLQRHLLTHSGERAFSCSICTKTFRQASHLKAHSRCHARPSGASRYEPGSSTDSEDGYVLKVRSQLLKDLKCVDEEVLNISLQNSNESKPERPNSSVREDCSHRERFWDRADSEDATNKTREDLRSRCTKEEMKEPPNLSSRFQCDVCLKFFTAPSKLKRHMMIHSSRRPYSCRLCSKAFRQLAHLKVHLVTHLSQRLHIKQAGRGNTGKKRPQVTTDVSRCLYKPRQGRSKRLDESTLSTESLESLNYECPTCLKCFSAPSKLRRHSLVHTGQRPFQCSFCSRAFQQLSHLKAHHSVHTRDQKKNSFLHLAGTDHTSKAGLSLTWTFHRSVKHFLQKTRVDQTAVSPRTKLNRKSNNTQGYVCTVCSKGFNAPSKLKRHALIHTGQKPFRCSVCCRGFTQKANLQVHKCTGRSKASPNQVQKLESIDDLDQDDSGTEAFISDEHSLSNSTQLENSDNSNTQFKASGLSSEETKESSFERTGCSKTFDFPSKPSRHLQTNIKPYKSFRQLCHLQCHSKVHASNRTCVCKASLKTDAPLPETSERNTGRMALETKESIRSPVQFQTEDAQMMLRACNPSHLQNSDSEVTGSSVYMLNQEQATPTSNSMTRKPGSSSFSFNVQNSGVIRPELQTSTRAQTQTEFDNNRCSFCLKTFAFPSKLSRHLLVHTGVRPYECHVCHKSFKQLSHLHCHRWVHSRKTSVSELQLEKNPTNHQDSGTFNELDLNQEDEDVYNRHHHQDWTSNSNSLDPVVCRIKLETDPSEGGSSYSIFQHNEDSPVTDGASRILVSLDEDHQKVDQCRDRVVQTSSDLFYKGWTSRPDTDEHTSAEIRKAKSRPLYIDRSGKSSEQVDQSCVDGEPDIPDCYGEEQQRSQDANPSVPENSGIESFELGSYQLHPSCFTSFQSEDPAAPHVLLDITRPPDELQTRPSCSRCFSTLDELQLHRCSLLSPEGKVRCSYQCAVCFKSFEAPSKLKRHYFIHTGQRPFQCPLCEKAFNQSNHLKAHMMSHR